MANTRITADMSVIDALMAMSDGNSGAVICMCQMLMLDPISCLDILLLDTMGIYGFDIFKLWSNCCNRDMDKLMETIQAFREGKFTEEEIHENLARRYPKPFI